MSKIELTDGSPVPEDGSHERDSPINQRNKPDALP